MGEFNEYLHVEIAQSMCSPIEDYDPTVRQRVLLSVVFGAIW